MEHLKAYECSLEKKEQVYEYLDSIGFEREFILGLLHKGYVVSGSLILKVLVKGNWEVGDLDFFIMIPSMLEVDQATEKLSEDFEVETFEISYANKNYPNKFWELGPTLIPNKTLNFYIESAKKAWKKKVNIVVGLGEIEKAEIFISNCFDFDICMNWLSSEGLYPRIKDLSPLTEEIELNPCVLKKLEQKIQSDSTGENSEEQAIQAPFKVELLPKLKSKHWWIKKESYRINKYKERGFKFNQLIGSK